MLPALLTPMVVWPAATAGTPDAARLIAAVAALLAGLRLGVIPSVVAGLGTVWLIAVLAD